MIGNPNTIGFEVVEQTGSKFINLTFYIGGRLISKEAVFLTTYSFSIKKLTEDLENGFYEVSSQELFSQNENELFKQFSTPSLDSSNKPHQRHLLHLDETIDQYLIYILEYQKNFKIIWQCWDVNSCNEFHEVEETYGVNLSKTEFLETLTELVKTLPNNQ